MPAPNAWGSARREEVPALEAPALSVSAVAVLVFLARAARAAFVPPDLAPGGGIVGVALGGGARRDAGARQRLGAGGRQRQFILAGDRAGVGDMHRRQFGHAVVRLLLHDLHPHEL